MLRSATETVVPTTCSISAVSAVRREAISDGRFSSKKRGARRSRLALHRDADVGDDALAQPRDEIEADRGRERQHDDDQQQIVELSCATVAAAARRSRGRSPA